MIILFQQPVHEIILRPEDVEVILSEQVFCETEVEGFKNEKTWSIALWISNDQAIYSQAKMCKSYDEFVYCMNQIGIRKNNIGINLRDSDLCVQELDEHIIWLNED